MLLFTNKGAFIGSLFKCEQYYFKAVVFLDRAIAGLIAGFVGAIIMTIWALISVYVLNLANRHFFGWSSILVFGHQPTNFAEILVALVFYLVWTAFLGVIFAFLIPTLTSKAYILKGAIFGFLLSFVFYIFPMFFNIPHLQVNTLDNVVTEMVGGTLWGTTTAIVLAHLIKQAIN